MENWTLSLKQVVEKKDDQLGNLKPEEEHSRECPEISLFLMYLKHGGEEAGNLEMPIGIDKITLQQKPILCRQRTRKRAT